MEGSPTGGTQDANECGWHDPRRLAGTQILIRVPCGVPRGGGRGVRERGNRWGKRILPSRRKKERPFMEEGTQGQKIKGRILEVALTH